MGSDSLSLPSTLYSTDRYANLHGKPQLVISIGSESLVQFFIQREHPGKAFLQMRAPFLQAELKDISLLAFTETLQRGGKELGVDEVEFRSAPPIYTEGKSWALGPQWVPVYIDSNYHIGVSSTSFIETLPSDQRRVLRLMNGAGQNTIPIGVEDLIVAYQVIAKNRAAKGYAINTSLGALSDAFMAMPDAYRAYLHKTKDGQAVGAAVIVQATSTIWYTYLLAHLSGTEGSPILALLEQIYNDAQHFGIQIVDLGTASLKGQIIPGLATFKRSVGGISTAKPTYSYWVL